VNTAAQEQLGRYYPVLDHGFVALIDVMGGDEAVEQAARVSYGTGTRKTSETRGLLRYLMRHRHTTPYEMVELKFHMAMPIFVARQWIRHRTASVNEYSGRYSLMPNLFYMPEPDDIGKQNAANRQGRVEAVAPEVANTFRAQLEHQRHDAVNTYKWAVAEDVARELARIDLPLSTYTQWYWKIDLHNLLHFLGLRCDSHAQYEIRAFADVMAALTHVVAPLAFEAWYDYAFLSCRFSRQEMWVLRNLVYRIHDETQRGLIAAREAMIGEAQMVEDFSLNKREVDEFLSRFDRFDEELPDPDADERFPLPTHFEAPEYFAQKWA
jgi:thymidylate synthase (FAD)